LAVTPEQAETLAQIDNNGKVRLALRPNGAREVVRTTGKTIQAALGRAMPAVATRPAPARPVATRPAAVRRAPARPALAPPPLPPKPVSHTIDVWRATTRSTVEVNDDR
jgi:hypothetical protein